MGNKTSSVQTTSSCDVCRKAKHARNRGRLCTACYAKVRRFRFKKAAVAYKGGECLRCGWRGLDAGFDFHHTADDKAFGISGAYCRSKKAIRAELDKCIMLCAMCHRLEHATCLSEALQKVADRTVIDFNVIEPDRMLSFCRRCGKKTSRGNTRCRSCARREQGSYFDWPVDVVLFRMVESENVNRVSQALGVSYNGLKKHLKKIRGVGG